MTSIERVVFDCNVFFQTLISPSGPAGLCFSAVEQGELQLIISQYVINELRDVCLRPHITNRFHITENHVTQFILQIEKFATKVNDVPHVFDYERDPDDAHYIDLAVVSNAKLIVSRDKDILVLRDHTSAEGKQFCQQFPELLILNPEELLNRLRRG